jgi:hypothetical protein
MRESDWSSDVCSSDLYMLCAGSFLYRTLLRPDAFDALELLTVLAE